ncbi:MAG: hypothetical protein IJ397_04435 [Lachnospiraceae bacterium]|nr:hypothetical protein [Lachnospiraceae bacterium]
MNTSEPNYRHFAMAKTAGTFAFAAVITALFGTMIFPFIFGGLSIIFAVLSKGNTAHYQLNARIAIIVSCIALIGNTAFTGFVFYNVFFNEEYREQLDETLEQLYGMSMDEYTSYMFSLPEYSEIPSEQ